MGRVVKRPRSDGGLIFGSNSEDGESYIVLKNIQNIKSIEPGD